MHRLHMCTCSASKSAYNYNYVYIRIYVQVIQSKVLILYLLQIRQMIIEQPVIHVQMIQSVPRAYITVKITFEFSGFTTTELIEIMNYDMHLTKLGNISILVAPKLAIFESTGTLYQA